MGLLCKERDEHDRVCFDAIVWLWKCYIQGSYMECVCSAQSENLRNLEIALHILRILSLRRQSRDCVTLVHNLKTDTRVQSRDCVTHVRNLEIA